MDVLQRLFEQRFHSAADRVEPLQGQLGGSGRNILRLANQQHSAIGILYGVREENVAFLEFTRTFLRHGLPVPEVYGVDLEQGAYLEQDLGNLSLFDFLSRNRDGEHIANEAVSAYGEVVRLLPRFQVEMRHKINYKVCHPRTSFDRQSIAWDLNYFKYYFLKLAGIPFNEQALENDFARLTKLLLSADRDYFLYRDFQSRNVMLLDRRPYFLDYQGGRKGALQYDIASLLFDSKADLPPAVRERLLDEYLAALDTHIPVKRDEFLHYYYAYVYIRLMQAMGAYGFRGFYERKPVFLQSVPYALKNLRWLLHNVTLPVALPALMDAFTAMLASEKLQKIATASDMLTVHVSSFSFHRGPLTDETGHGGGFVFDARSLPNPGREERFKPLSGKDAPVANYLNQQDSVHRYLASVISLVDATVDTYQRRGFASLSIAFGCTGGQHRSVFLAEELARHLRERNGVNIVVRHRELDSQPR